MRSEHEVIRSDMQDQLRALRDEMHSEHEAIRNDIHDFKR